MNDGKQIIENVVRKALEDAVKAEEAEEAGLPEPKVPEGCVERTLTMRDRNAIVGACEAYCQKEGHKGLLDQTRLNKIKKLLNWDETLEYFAMLDDALDEEVRIWRREKSQYKLWRDYRAGLVTAQDVKRAYPTLDLEAEPEKPSLREPELKPDEKRGPKKAVHLPSKLDAWVQDCLKSMQWLVKMDELAVEVCEKFGIRSDD